MTRTTAFVVLAALAFGTAHGAAPVALHDRTELAAELEKGTPCCVIDARPPAARAFRPLTEALAYTRGMKINPTAAVAVIADTDENGMRAGEDLARTNKAAKVIVVKGGLATWEAVVAPGRSSTGGVPLTFVIPKNTCEQGAPLQTLRAGPAARPH
jgi:hypothetical protein